VDNKRGGENISYTPFKNLNRSCHQCKVGEIGQDVFIFLPPFLQKQFTNSGWHKYKGISVGNSVAEDLGQPDIAGDFGQPSPCCHSSIKLASARQGWNGHTQQELEAKVI